MQKQENRKETSILLLNITLKDVNGHAGIQTSSALERKKIESSFEG